MTGVSTYGVYNAVLAAASRVQTTLATKEVQEASGYVGSTDGDLGAQAGEVIDLKNSIAQAESYASNAATAGDRVQAMYSAVGSMIDVLTSLRSTISAAISGSESSTVSTEGSSTLSELADLMNTEESGVYLFSGSATGTAPVDLDSLTASTATGTVNTSYYAGDDDAASVAVSSTDSITYGVTADESAFEEAIRAANVCANLGSDPSSSTLQSVYDLATSALTSLTDTQSGLSIDASRLTDVQDEQSSYISLTDTMVDDVETVDVSEVATQVSNYQAQLEASYSALSVLLKTHLVNYL